jgi:hypothetical protein
VGLIPESDPVGSTFGHITSIFARLGFTAREVRLSLLSHFALATIIIRIIYVVQVAALFGAHTLGRAETENSGFSGTLLVLPPCVPESLLIPTLPTLNLYVCITMNPDAFDPHRQLGERPCRIRQRVLQSPPQPSLEPPPTERQAGVFSCLFQLSLQQAYNHV